MKVIGLMSGTSGDGVDAALVDIHGSGERLRVSPVAFTSISYSPALQRRILRAGLTGTVQDICHLNAVLGEIFARAALKVMIKGRVSRRTVALIGSHGQTVHHLPRGIREPGLGVIRSTLQIAEPAVIAERTGITTVANFRTRDMAAGGQGAPLAPSVHHLLFAHPSKSRAIVNLGGISNVTFLPKGGARSSVRAFDTGPANMLLDGVVQRITRGRQSMDRHGRLAMRGAVDPVLLRQLMRHPFLHRRPPKSTGREEFGEPLVSRLLRERQRRRLTTADLLATLAQFTAEAVATANRWLSGPVHEVLVCGGGVRNRAVMEALGRVFAPAPVRSLEEIGWSSQALEATAFAVFAYQTLHGVSSNLPRVTGASHPVLLGQVVPGRGPLPRRLRVGRR